MLQAAPSPASRAGPQAAQTTFDAVPVLQLVRLWVAEQELSLRLHAGSIVQLRGGSRAQRLHVLCIAAGMPHDGPGWCRLGPGAVGRLLCFDSMDAGLSVLEAVALPLLNRGQAPTLALQRARQCLRWLGLADAADVVTDSLAPRQRRLALIARALAGRPALLVVEDLDQDLGPADIAAVRAALRVAVASEGCAILMTTSQARLASMADRNLDLGLPLWS
jgi:ABC-type taurine transport system ATPase subunit